mgnify:CR=1 FL=1
MERNLSKSAKVDVADPIGTGKVAPNYSDDTPLTTAPQNVLKQATVLLFTS